MTDWTTAHYADSRKLVAWLDEIGQAQRVGVVIGDIATRILYRWRHESTVADVYAVDRMLAPLDLHLWEVPEDVWLDLKAKPERKKGKRFKPEQRAKAVAAWHESGGKTKDIAQRWGVTPRSVHNWVRADIGGGGVNSNEKSLDPSAVASGVEEAA